MRKKLLLILVFCLLLTGCRVGKQDNQGEIIGDFASSLSFVDKRLETGEIALFVRNNNTEDLKAEIEIIFYNRKDKKLASVKEELELINASEEQVVILKETSKKYSYYKIIIDGKKATKLSRYEDLAISKTNDGEKTTVNITNNGDEQIEHIKLYLVFYNDEEITTYKLLEETKFPVGEEKSFVIDLNEGDYVYNHYEVFVNSVY